MAYYNRPRGIIERAQLVQQSGQYFFGLFLGTALRNEGASLEFFGFTFGDRTMFGSESVAKNTFQWKVFTKFRIPFSNFEKFK